MNEFDFEEIISNTKNKIKSNSGFSDEDLVKLALTPIFPKSKEEIISQFQKTADLISQIDFPNSDIRNSICGMVLMLSNIYSDETGKARKKYKVYIWQRSTVLLKR